MKKHPEIVQIELSDEKMGKIIAELDDRSFHSPFRGTLGTTGLGEWDLRAALKRHAKKAPKRSKARKIN